MTFHWRHLVLLISLLCCVSFVSSLSQLKSLPPLPSSFDFDYGRQMVYMAWSSYCNYSAVMNWTCMWCSQNSDFVADAFATSKETGCQGYAAYSKASQTVVVSFRGTIDFANVIYDIDPMKVRPYKNVTGALVHAGFEDSYLSLAEPLLDAVATRVAGGGVAAIVATGHSLGGSMAGLAAIDLRLQFPSVPRIAVINMGMPRTGNKAFSDYYASLGIETWRAVHYHDLIPHFPFRYFPIEGGYYHVPGEVWAYNKTDIYDVKVCSLTDGEDPSCSDSVPAWEWNPIDHLTYYGIYQNNCH